MIDPEFFLDEELSSTSAYARLLYIGLWGICDDNYATLPDQPGWIKAQVFPYQEVDVAGCLKELEKIGKIVRFEVDSKPFWFIKNFFKHQRIDKPSGIKYPPYPSSTQIVIEEDSTSPRSEEKLSKEKRREEKGIEREVLSPRQKAEKFFESAGNKDEHYYQFVELLSKQNNIAPEAIRKELGRFVDYWTEPNQTGKKLKWQAQKFFDVRRRLSTWFSRSGFSQFTAAKGQSKYEAGSV